MSYEIKVYNPKELSQRAYIHIKIDGKRVKEYNGGKIGVDIKPNLVDTHRKRTALLNELLFAFKKAIEKGEYPKTTIEKTLSTKEVLLEALNQKKLLNLNHNYIRNLQRVYDNFIAFLSDDEREGGIGAIQHSRIQEFLLQFNSSGTYYMNKRRDLSVLFSQAGKYFALKTPNVKDTNRLKSKPNLHQIYTDEQLKNVLAFLKANHYNLYLCCLISYGCLLRPHQEVRKLTVGHFRNDYTEIHLSAKENKSGRIRVVQVPKYVRVELLSLLKEKAVGYNIFSLDVSPFNEAYFSTAWTRMHLKMIKLDIIAKKQTIYSFRHTAAVNFYLKNKDLHLLQQLMGHSDMVVTLKYLRGLGINQIESFRNYMPNLPV